MREEFKAWVGEQAPLKSYDYADPKGCAFAQFLAHKYPDAKISVGPHDYRLNGGEWLELPEGVDDAVHQHPRTFAALYERL